MEFIALICPYCDSLNIKLIDFNEFECNECDNQFDLHEADASVLRINE